MMNVQVPPPAAMSDAMSLLTALADPKSIQARLDQLKRASDDYRDAAAQSKKECDAAHAAQEALAAREASLSAREAAATAREARVSERETSVASREANIAAFRAEMDALASDPIFNRK